MKKKREKKENKTFNYKILIWVLIIFVLIFVGMVILFGRSFLFNPGDSVTRSFNDSEIHVGEMVNVTLRIISNSQGSSRRYIINEWTTNYSKVVLVPCSDGVFTNNVLTWIDALDEVTIDLCYTIKFLESGSFSGFFDGNFIFQDLTSGEILREQISGPNSINVFDYDEICDGFDNDNDQEIDEENICSANFYCDNDTDTYFDKNVDGNCNLFNCVPTNCRNAIGNDCNDSNFTINPSKTEICDNIDNDCDNLMDEGSLCSGSLVCQDGACVQPGCNSVWVQHNESCIINDTRVVWYEDTNCSLKKANETYDCDFNSNGIIGNISDVRTLRIDSLKIYIDGRKFNWSKDYADDEYEVEFMDEDENIILSFDYDFEDDPALNLKNIYLEKQRSSSDFGYLIVDGLTDINKTFLVEKVESDSEYVCVKDKEILDMGDFSDKCTGSKEYWVKCPGNNSKFKCIVAGSFFSVSGLKNSAIKELINFIQITNSNDNDDDTASCSQRWNCVWSNCNNNIQTYDCVDLNNCNNLTGMPSQSPRACSSQTTTTTTTTNASGETGKTPTEKGKIIFYVLISVIILIFLIVLIIFFVEYTKKKNQISVPVRYG